MCKKKILLALLLVTAMITGTACNVRSIRGSGNLVTETRQVRNFDRISLSGSGEVILTQGGSESLTIESDDNVMEYVEAVVEGGTLKLGFKNGFNIISTTRLVFRVGIDTLSGLSVSGSGKVEADRIDTDRLKADVSGSGNILIADLTASEVNADISGSGEINLTGEVQAQDVSVSGSGKYLGENICSASVTVRVSGSGNAMVCATGTLDARTSGSGSVGYYGQPASVHTSESGSGKINNLGDK